MSVRRGAERSRRQLSFAEAHEEVSEPSTCTLCLGRHQQFSTPANWKSEDARTLALSLKVSPDCLVCSACRKDVTRVLANDAYIPRWEKLKERSTCKNTCCIAQCSEIPFASLHTASDQLQSTLVKVGLKCSISEIEEMDPKLWDAVTFLTQSESERRGTSKVTDPASPAYQIKRIRRFFLLCSLLFITDDRCSIPLHVLLADLVECQGASALLHRMLNRLGVCASTDTLSRFMQHNVKDFNSTADRYISTESFTVVSADNVDFLHTYARVVK